MKLRDPRLVEIDFLMELEAATVFQLMSTMEERTSGVRVRDSMKLFGLDAPRFRDLMLDFILSGVVVGYAAHSTSNYVTEGKFDEERAQILEQLIAGQQVSVLLSHRGRVRLWNLRDALLRDPDIEPMGLRSKAAWERDLFVQLKWASPEQPLSIIFLDLDNFGAVNKDLGSGVGDDVLRATFTLTKNYVGSRGTVYRFGGEEIGILLPNSSHDAAKAIAEELRRTVETEVAAQVLALGRHQTASVGVGTFDSRIEPRAALDHVDAAMREAKRSGKNCVVARPFAAT